jgi:hypothetical protein
MATKKTLALTLKRDRETKNTYRYGQVEGNDALLWITREAVAGLGDPKDLTVTIKVEAPAAKPAKDAKPAAKASKANGNGKAETEKPAESEQVAA